MCLSVLKCTRVDFGRTNLVRLPLVFMFGWGVLQSMNELAYKLLKVGLSIGV